MQRSIRLGQEIPRPRNVSNYFTNVDDVQKLRFRFARESQRSWKVKIALPTQFLVQCNGETWLSTIL